MSRNIFWGIRGYSGDIALNFFLLSSGLLSSWSEWRSRGRLARDASGSGPSFFISPTHSQPWEIILAFQSPNTYNVNQRS